MVQKNKIFTFLIFMICGLSLAIPNKSYGQINYDMLKSLLIIQFSEHVTWPNESEIKRFNIGMVGKDTATFNILSNLMTKRLIKGKTCQLSWISDLNKINSLQILYIDKTKSMDLVEFLHAIENKNILLISEQSMDTKNIMLNILKVDKKKLSFEVNKANIIIEHLEVNPEILLLGGTEVDIRGLYRDIKKQFENELINVEKQKASIALQKIDINKQRNQIAANESEIALLKSNTEELTEQILKKENDLSQLSENIALQENSIKDQKHQLFVQEELLRTQNKESLIQSDLIAARSIELDSLINEAEIQKNIISNQSTTLESKEQIIDLQQKVIYIIIVFVIALAILSIIVFRFYKLKRTMSVKLEDSYVTLREQHHSILQLNEELNTINEMLEEKVKERTSVLEARNTQLTEYAFINSHMLRAPLSKIKGLSHLLTSEKLNVKDHKIVDALLKSTDELDEIIRKISDLLYEGKDFSREEIESIVNRKLNPPRGSDFRDN